MGGAGIVGGSTARCSRRFPGRRLSGRSCTSAGRRRSSRLRRARSSTSGTSPHGSRPSASGRPVAEPLPALPLDSWERTKETLHLWVQIVGKVRMASSAPRNHWWHVPLYVDVRGLTTRRLHAQNGVTFEIAFDFVDHRLVVLTNRGEVESFALVDGLSVSEF